MLRVVRTPAAVRDLAAITDYILAHNLTAAIGFLEDIDRVLRLIAQHPLLGEAADHLAPGLRRHTVGNYLLFYRPRADSIELIRVLHGARDMERLL